MKGAWRNGIRNGLKIRRPRGLKGSSPFAPTNSLITHSPTSLPWGKGANNGLTETVLEIAVKTGNDIMKMLIERKLTLFALLDWADLRGIDTRTFQHSDFQ